MGTEVILVLSLNNTETGPKWSEPGLVTKKTCPPIVVLGPIEIVPRREF